MCYYHIGIYIDTSLDVHYQPTLAPPVTVSPLRVNVNRPPAVSTCSHFEGLVFEPLVSATLELKHPQEAAGIFTVYLS